MYRMGPVVGGDMGWREGGGENTCKPLVKCSYLSFAEHDFSFTEHLDLRNGVGRFP